MRAGAHIWWVVGVAVALAGLATVLPRTAPATVVERVNDKREKALENRDKAVEPDAAARQMIDKLAGYEGWARFSNDLEPLDRDVHGHHARWAVRYYNATAQPALKGQAWRFAAGSVLVDEDRRARDGRPTDVTAMVKQPDGQWYWINLTPDGEVMTKKGVPMTGQVGTCILCHSQAKRDMVFMGSP